MTDKIIVPISPQNAPPAIAVVVDTDLLTKQSVAYFELHAQTIGNIAKAVFEYDPDAQPPEVKPPEVLNGMVIVAERNLLDPAQSKSYMELHRDTIAKIANAVTKRPIPDAVRKLIEARLATLGNEIGYERYDEHETAELIAEQNELQRFIA